MTEFMGKYPGVEIVVQEDTTADLLKLLLIYESDFALASQPIQDGRLEVCELFTEELLLALPPGHRLTRCSAKRDSSQWHQIVQNKAPARVLLGNRRGFGDYQARRRPLSIILSH